MYLLISGTSSLWAVVFTLMPITSISFLIQSNCLSLRMCLILIPMPGYVLITCFRNFIIVALLLSFIISKVPNRIVLDLVKMKRILLIFIISTAKVTFPLYLSIPSGCQVHSVLVLRSSCGWFRP